MFSAFVVWVKSMQRLCARHKAMYKLSPVRSPQIAVPLAGMTPRRGSADDRMEQKQFTNGCIYEPCTTYEVRPGICIRSRMCD